MPSCGFVPLCWFLRGPPTADPFSPLVFLFSFFLFLRLPLFLLHFRISLLFLLFSRFLLFVSAHYLTPPAPSAHSTPPGINTPPTSPSPSVHLHILVPSAPPFQSTSVIPATSFPPAPTVILILLSYYNILLFLPAPFLYPGLILNFCSFCSYFSFSTC